MQLIHNQPDGSSLHSPAVTDLQQASLAPGARSAVTPLLMGSEVFVLDDDRSMLVIGARLLETTFQIPANFIHCVNPKALSGKATDHELTLEQVVETVTKPIVQAVNDPTRTVAFILTDFEMGVLNADLLLSSLRAQIGQDLPFKIIVNSANPDIVFAGEGNFDVFIPKPLGVIELQQAITFLFPEAKLKRDGN